MTSRDTTGLFSLPDADRTKATTSLSDVLHRLAFGAIGWPWLLYSLWGGTKRSKRALLKRLGLGEGALPNLGSWKADTGFLHRIVDSVEELRPQTVVELGAGASTLVCAKALALNGGGTLVSFDQHRDFVEATARWVAEEGAVADLRWAPLEASIDGWPGRWYALSDIPENIDLLIIDGPPWAVHPFVRGAAECLFERLSPGGIVLLDDAARPGERIVARRWRANWPGIVFERLNGSTKGTLVGRKSAPAAPAKHWPAAVNDNGVSAAWRRAAAVFALFGAGWGAAEFTEGLSPPAHAASIVEEAHAALAASETRQAMASQPEGIVLDRAEITEATGIVLPILPAGWEAIDVQLYPSDLGNSLMLSLATAQGDEFALFAARAETPAGEDPLWEERSGKVTAYWEEGEMAFALVGDTSREAVLEAAVQLAETGIAETPIFPSGNR